MNPTVPHIDNGPSSEFDDNWLPAGHPVPEETISRAELVDMFGTVNPDRLPPYTLVEDIDAARRYAAEDAAAPLAGAA
ncbi:hypothetical protein [Verrucosispora sp. WMMC514]|uniref:hypothetical protein n=1 Tax=Verrucosispora sp. WMMC514 TaxID=3015156 RepID=UPI00248BADBD|nr:hypothetical protein [Verrucosispora sp. WMMC514]WBB94264.1 hypothetical protein O7597_15545 [Verrucosispora sp. WMMC514]